MKKMIKKKETVRFYCSLAPWVNDEIIIFDFDYLIKRNDKNDIN